MTFVGKILVVVQLVLSICFMAFAGAVFTVQENWREKFSAEEKSNEELTTANTALQGEFDVFRTDTTKLVLGEQAQVSEIEDRLKVPATVGLDQQIETANATLANLQSTVTQLRSELAATQSERDNAAAESQIAAREAKERRLEAELQRVRNAKLRVSLEETIQKLRGLEDEDFNKERLLKELNRRFTSMAEQLATAKEVIARSEYDEGITKTSDPLPPPEVGGLVLEARKTRNRSTEFVHISIGSDDGLAVGHTLHVYRPAQKNGGRAMYLGKIELVRVAPDEAVGTVIERAKNGVIERNDNVTTKL